MALMLKSKPTKAILETDVTVTAEEAIKTEIKSIVYVRQIAAVAVSNIFFARGLFPHDCFRSRMLYGQTVRIVKNDTKNKTVTQFFEWMHGAFEAMNKRYLRQIIIGLTPENQPNAAYETYTFSINYTDYSAEIHQAGGNKETKKINIDNMKAENLCAEAIKMIRRGMKLTRDLDTLPADVSISMMLTYYDDVTPVHYEPPGFKASSTAEFIYPGPMSNYKLGKFSTPFHTIHFNGTVKGGVNLESAEIADAHNGSGDIISAKEINDDDIEKLHTEDLDNLSKILNEKKNSLLQKSLIYNLSVEERQELTAINQTQRKLDDKKKNPCETGSFCYEDEHYSKVDCITNQLDCLNTTGSRSLPNVNAFGFLNSESANKADYTDNPLLNYTLENKTVVTKGADTTAGSVSDNTIINSSTVCVCGSDEEFDEMIKCAVCATWQHSCCYGIFNAKQSMKHAQICVTCYKPDVHVVADKNFLLMAPAERLTLAWYRRSVSYCLDRARIKPDRMLKDLKMQEEMLPIVMNYLTNNGILFLVKNSKTVYKVNSTNFPVICQTLFPVFNANACNSILESEPIIESIQQTPEVTSQDYANTAPGAFQDGLDDSVSEPRRTRSGLKRICTADSSQGATATKVSRCIRKKKL